ncbi:phage tail protein [Bartonella doshiae]|uniref:phage tail protein n=1 Tax=Bartonella doshiae TaxID=33044 RepID=UPI0009450298|nr:phage tail protein [Bartonella doshiae]
MSDIYDWSLTASENAGADDLIDWSEGQAPHTVNNSARVMMQRIREYLSDRGGVIESTFTVNHSQQTTSIRLQTKSQFLEYKNDLVLRFKSNGWNIGATTVSLNGQQSKAVYKATETGISPLIGGEIQNGHIYTLVYDEEISGWQLLNPTIREKSPFTHLPTGFIGMFAMETLPDGWLLCDGQAYSRSLYRDLFAMIGTIWGSGDDETTFNVPDLRGMFLRGFDYSGFVEGERSFASTQECSLRDHEHSLGVVSPAEISSRSRRDLSSVNNPLKRSKRNIIVDYEIIGEECAGLSGDALKMCNMEFDKITQPLVPPQKVIPSVINTHHPFFLRYGHAIRVYTIPKRAGEDLGIHDHTIMMGSFGGEETRPINVSVVYGIKT